MVMKNELCMALFKFFEAFTEFKFATLAKQILYLTKFV